MPMQPPRFHPKGWKPSERRAWQRPERHVDQRQRGRRGMKARAQVLAEEPLCRLCLEEGRTTASEEVDHIIPMAQGGTDDRENKQGLCKPCHRAKTQREAAEGSARAARFRKK